MLSINIPEFVTQLITRIHEKKMVRATNIFSGCFSARGLAGIPGEVMMGYRAAKYLIPLEMWLIDRTHGVPARRWPAIMRGLLDIGRLVETVNLTVRPA